MTDIVARITRKNSGTFDIELSSGKIVRVSEDLFVQEALYKGQGLSDEKVASLVTAAKLDQGFQQALHYLSYQLRSEKEMVRYLTDKEIPAKESKEIITKLKERRLLDDKIYGESYVRTMLKTSDKGPLVVRQNLKKRGLTDQMVDTVLSLYTPEEEIRMVTSCAAKLGKKSSRTSHKETLKKIQLTLMTKGYSHEAIQAGMEALDLVKDEDNEWEQLVKQGDRVWQRSAKLDARKRSLKVKQSLFQKGYDYDLIQQYITEKEQEE